MRLAAQLQQLTQQCTDIKTEILLVVDAYPLTEVLLSMPVMGIRTAARILTEVVDKDFKSAAHLASYAGIAPITRQSGPRSEAIALLAPTMTRNAPKRNVTTKPSSP